MVSRGRVEDPADQDVLRRVGDASVLILTSLADGPKHGYALIQDIKGFAGLQLGPGTSTGHSIDSKAWNSSTRCSSRASVATPIGSLPPG